ncbi:MAG: hypothetical protein JW982_06130 [Spirochaetes bacterium]|nr:hypothetical protein [Spirochaetota bacterium]
MKKLLFAVLTGVFLVSCASAPVVSYKSDKFAHFQKYRSIYKAVSSNNVRIIAYKVDSETKENQVAELWINEIKLVLKSKGYNFIKSESFLSDKGENVVFSEFETYFNGELYIYSLAIMPEKNKLIISEAGGRKTDYSACRNDVIKIIKSI